MALLLNKPMGPLGNKSTAPGHSCSIQVTRSCTRVNAKDCLAVGQSLKAALPYSRTIVIPCHWWVFELFFLLCSISFRLWVTLTCSFLQSLMKTKRRTKHYHQALQLSSVSSLCRPQIREVQKDQSHTATRRFHQLCQVDGWQITCHLWRQRISTLSSQSYVYVASVVLIV